MAIAVDAGGTPQVTHSPTVAVDGESIPFDNTVSVSSSVMSPEVFFQFSPSVPVAGSQDIVGLTLLNSLSHDVSGTLTVAFSSDAIIPTDDPAIQFSSGGRSVSFLIPANSLQARFGSNLQSSPIAYQSGTVAGTLTFRVTLQSGAFQTSFSNVRTLPRQAPTIHSVQKEADGLRINLSSTMREVTQLSLSFATSPSVLPSCGAAAGCVATGNTLLLDIKSLVDTWYRGDSRFGSLASLRLPLSIQGIVRGGLQVSLRNSMGVSNTVSVPLP
jgi:hypothetical protein